MNNPKIQNYEKPKNVKNKFGGYSPQNEQFDFLPDGTTGWDGLYGGKALNPGVFIYVIEVERFNGEKEMFSGDVTLVK